MPAFKHDLVFGCLDNFCVCVLTYMVPCYVEGKIAEKVGESCFEQGFWMLIPVMNILCGACIREKVRKQKNIDGSYFGDLLALACCTLCSLAQEALEVDALEDKPVVTTAPTAVAGSTTVVRE